ncbi:MAG: hypothetical protein AABZ53_01745 [Planctomycetota bacterium]
MSDEIPLSPKLIELTQAALEHACGSICEGGPLVPFVMWVKPGGDDASELNRFLQPADADGGYDLGESVERAHDFLMSLSGKAERAVFAFDGMLTLEDGEQVDAIFLEAFEVGAEFAYRFAQCYLPASEADEFAPIDEPVLVEEFEPLW